MKQLPMILRSLYRRCRGLGRDKRGNAAIIFALTAVPLIALTGLGVDYYTGLSYKARLDAAADAAALAAINATKAYVGANPQSQSGATISAAALTTGQTQGGQAFNANAGASGLLVPQSALQVTVVQNATNPLVIDATVQYAANVPTNFGGLVGVKTFNVGGTSKASMELGAYQDFYLVLDTSASMGLPTAAIDQQTLANGLAGLGYTPLNQMPQGAHNDPFNPGSPDNVYYRSWNTATKKYDGPYPNGCMFACHYSGQQSFGFAQANNIQLRIDALAGAVLNLLNYAMQPGVAMFPNQYRIGVYPFIVDAVQAVPLSYVNSSQTAMFTPQPVPLPTSDPQINSWLFPLGPVPRDAPFKQANTYATPFATTYLDSGSAGAIGGGGTHFEHLWTDFQNNNWLQGSGVGTSSSPQGFIFLVTDGVDNNQICEPSCNGSTPQLPPTSPTTSDFCQSAKNAGYTVAVLLIPYVPIANPTTFGNNEDNNVNQYASGTPSQIETRMQACATGGATGGFYAEANSSQDITNAIQGLFRKATQQARLTQ
jgi:Flp pilus assembly protein TadG